MSDETNDAPAADVEDGAAEALADAAAADAPVTVEDLVAALEALTAQRDQHHIAVNDGDDFVEQNALLRRRRQGEEQANQSADEQESRALRCFFEIYIIHK